MSEKEKKLECYVKVDGTQYVGFVGEVGNGFMIPRAN